MEKRTKKTSSLKKDAPTKLLDAGFDPKLQASIDSTVMAIREHLMDYFKGTHVESVTESNIRLAPKTIRTRRHYEIRNAQLKNTQYLSMAGLILLEVEKNPQKITFNGRTLKRSKAMEALAKEIEAFIGKYLRGVEVVWDNNTGDSEPHESTDVAYFTNNKPRNMGPVDPYSQLRGARFDLGAYAEVLSDTYNSGLI